MSGRPVLPRLTHATLNHSVEVGAQTKASVALWKVHPGKTMIEACAPEGNVVHRLWIILREKCINS